VGKVILNILILLRIFTIPSGVEGSAYNPGGDKRTSFNLEESLMRASDLPKKEKIEEIRANQFIPAKGIILLRLKRALPPVLNQYRDGPCYCRLPGSRISGDVDTTPLTCLFFIKERVTPDKFMAPTKKESIITGNPGKVGGMRTISFISMERPIMGIITFWHNSPPTCTLILTGEHQ
jgi:hypothetical protein